MVLAALEGRTPKDAWRAGARRLPAGAGFAGKDPRRHPHPRKGPDPRDESLTTVGRPGPPPTTPAPRPRRPAPPTPAKSCPRARLLPTQPHPPHHHVSLLTLDSPHPSHPTNRPHSSTAPPISTPRSRPPPQKSGRAQGPASDPPSKRVPNRLLAGSDCVRVLHGSFAQTQERRRAECPALLRNRRRCIVGTERAADQRSPERVGTRPAKAKSSCRTR